MLPVFIPFILQPSMRWGRLWSLFYFCAWEIKTQRSEELARGRAWNHSKDWQSWQHWEPGLALGTEVRK